MSVEGKIEHMEEKILLESDDITITSSSFIHHYKQSEWNSYLECYKRTTASDHYPLDEIKSVEYSHYDEEYTSDACIYICLFSSGLGLIFSLFFFGFNIASILIPIIIFIIIKSSWKKSITRE